MDYCSACLLSFFFPQLNSLARAWTSVNYCVLKHFLRIYLKLTNVNRNRWKKSHFIKVQMKTHTNHKCRTVRITLNEEYWLNLNELNFKFNWNIEWNWLKFVCDCTQIIRFGVDTRFNARPFDYWTGWYEQLENLFTIQTTTNLWEIQNQKWLQRTRTDSTVAYTVIIYFSSFSL